MLLKTKKFQPKLETLTKLTKRISSALEFLVMKIKKNIQSIYQKKCCEEKHVDLLLTGEEGKRHCVLIKYFITFMYDHNLHRGRKHFCRYCLQAFNTEEVLKPYFKD